MRLANSREPQPMYPDDCKMRRLYQEHHPAVMRLVLSLTRDRQCAEDVVQETFLRLWRHPETLLNDRRTVRAWLFAVARRIVIDCWRARACRPQEVDATVLETQPANNSDLQRVLARHVIRQAMETLSPAHRAVVVELYYHDRSVAETARRLGIPLGTVKSRAHHAIRALRDNLT